MKYRLFLVLALLPLVTHAVEKEVQPPSQQPDPVPKCGENYFYNGEAAGSVATRCGKWLLIALF